MNITYTEIPWELLTLCLTDGWELELLNEKTQTCIVYKMGEQPLDSDGFPEEVGKPERKHPAPTQPPMRHNN
jgi:hypothetical protein